MGLSLALASAALAQQPEDTASPAAGKGKHNKTEATSGAQGQTGANAEGGAGGKHQRGGGKAARGESNAQPDAANA